MANRAEAYIRVTALWVTLNPKEELVKLRVYFSNKISLPSSTEVYKVIVQLLALPNLPGHRRAAWPPRPETRAGWRAATLSSASCAATGWAADGAGGGEHDAGGAGEGLQVRHSRSVHWFQLEGEPYKLQPHYSIGLMFSQPNPQLKCLNKTGFWVFRSRFLGSIRIFYSDKDFTIYTTIITSQEKKGFLLLLTRFIVFPTRFTS